MAPQGLHQYKIERRKKTHGPYINLAVPWQCVVATTAKIHNEFLNCVPVCEQVFWRSHIIMGSQAVTIYRQKLVLNIRNFWPTKRATKNLCCGQFLSLHSQPSCDSVCVCLKWAPLVWICVLNASMYEIWPCWKSTFPVWAAIHSVATGAKTTKHCCTFQFVNLPKIAELLFCTFSCNVISGRGLGESKYTFAHWLEPGEILPNCAEVWLHDVGSRTSELPVG